ncbi:Cuticular protein 97Eb [Carabus blaptoides fortunei]
MKFVIISSLIVTVFLIQTVLAQKHNNQWGKHGFGDKLLRREIVKEKSKFLQVVTKNVEYKFANNITFINATDQYVDGNGGYATLLKGGVGLRGGNVGCTGGEAEQEGEAPTLVDCSATRGEYSLPNYINTGHLTGRLFISALTNQDSDKTNIMKCFLLMLGAALLSVAYAQKYTTPVPILKQINKHNEDGSYSYGYEGADGTFKIETKYADGQVYGKYGYVDDSGKVREVEYGASRRGFEPQGNDINVAPPTLKAKNEYVVPLREGEQDDGQYREDPAVYYKDEAYNQPAYQQQSYQQPAYKQPTYQDSSYQQPAYERQEPVYRPQQPVFRPQQPAYQPQQPAYQPQQPVYQPQQPAYQPTYRAPDPRPVAKSNFDDFENFRSSLGFSQPKPKATYTPSYTPPANNYNTGNNQNRGYTSNSYKNSEQLPFNVDLNSGSYSLNY